VDRFARKVAVALAMLLALLYLLPSSGAGREAGAASPPRVVLTFDDGYNFDHRILEYLNSQGITATAFVIGSWAQKNTSLLQEMDSLGWDVCNHTQNHPWLTKLTDQQIVAELNTCQAVIGAATGQYLPLFRPPGGAIDARVTGIAATAGYAPVMWDFDSKDALNAGLSVQDRVNHMVGGAGDGDIILFHFGGRNTLELVMGVVQGLQQKGFGFVTLSELYGWKQLVRGGDSGPGISDAAKRHYFAEGTTRNGYEEWLLVFNPGDVPASIKAKYYSAQGSADTVHTVPPRERLSIYVKDEVSWLDDVSVVLESSVPVAVERMLYFNRGSGYSGGSLSRSINDASRVYFFPEGTVRPGFEEYIAIFNTSAATPARVELELSGPGKEASTSSFDVLPLSRLTLRVNDMAEEGDYSAVVNSSIPVVAERSEYFVYGDTLTGSHSSPGIAQPGVRWYFAEGTTRGFFDNYLIVLNPCAYDTWLEIDMVVSDGSMRRESMRLAAGERKTLHLNAYLPPEVDYSLILSSLLPVAAERSAYFRFHNIAGGYCSQGTPQPRENWLFPEGCTGDGFSEWLALFNPQDQELIVEVEYTLGGAGKVRREYLLPPQGRLTVDVAAESGKANEVSMEVSCEAGVVAERSTYFSYQAR
jgi:peptidoglycan-N-acetylglucosamine deacetylase